MNHAESRPCLCFKKIGNDRMKLVIQFPGNITKSRAHHAEEELV